MNSEIGGYFSLELQRRDSNLHKDGLSLNSGRNCFEYILRTIEDINCIWIPLYTCDVLMQPIERLNLDFKFYSINDKLEIDQKSLDLADGDYLLYTNYFGIKDNYVEQILKIYSKRLIVDNAQALFALPSSNCFYSPRKFVGIPDGGIVYSDKEYNIAHLEQDISYDRCLHLLKRFDMPASSAYNDFKANSSKLNFMELKRMSFLTQSLINNIDFDKVKLKRNENFNALHSLLGNFNCIEIQLNTFKAPLVYPFYVKGQGEELKSYLIENKIYVATYWPNVIVNTEDNCFESDLAKNLVPIPIDQRYDNCDMRRIAFLILDYLFSNSH